MNVLAALPLPLLALLPQDPTTALARFRLEGKDAIVTRADVALEMAFHLRRRERGRQAVDQLVDTALTRTAATKRNLMPTTGEIEEFWARLQQQLRDAGHRPEEFAAVRNTSPEQWRADLAAQIAQERLVRAELGLGPQEPVSADMLKLWLQEARRRATIVADPDQLPAGVAARIDGAEVPLLDLGLLLLRTAEDDERDRFVRQVVYLRAIEALARRQDVAVSDADLDAAVQRRRDEAARDPRYSGVGFDQMLKAQGLSIPSLRELRVFRAQILLDKLTDRAHPADQLLAEVQRDRQRLLDLIGPRRHLGVIFVRALDEPNALVPLDFAAAEARLLEARRRLAGETFANVATIESHDPSKQRGGDVGWHRRRSDQLPEVVLAAAFALTPGDVSQPLRAEEGCWLVKVLAAEPEPTNAQLVDALRTYRGQELQQRILQDAAIEIVGAPPEASK